MSLFSFLKARSSFSFICCKVRISSSFFCRRVRISSSFFRFISAISRCSERKSDIGSKLVIVLSCLCLILNLVSRRYHPSLQLSSGPTVAAKCSYKWLERTGLQTSSSAWSDSLRSCTGREWGIC